MNDPEFEQAIENTKPIGRIGQTLANAAFAKVAQERGRTVENQIRRMGDRFAYEKADMDPNQKQLDEYEIRGDTVRVEP